MRASLLLICLLPFMPLAGALVDESSDEQRESAADEMAKGMIHCKTIHYRDEISYTIKARLHHSTHIILPGNLLLDPVTGNKDLWQVEGVYNHIFVKPSTKEIDEGGSTTVTALIEGNRSFHFLALRSDDDFDLCVVVRINDDLITGERVGLWRDDSDMSLQLQSAEQTIGELQSRLLEQDARGKQAVEHALSRYRGFIYTRYDWTGGKQPFGKNLVSDVYDDGRFTYVRLNHDVAGVYAMFAVNAKREQIIDYHYDEAAKMYTVTGIFDELKLKEDEKNVITIRRLDDNTHGNY